MTNISLLLLGLASLLYLAAGIGIQRAARQENRASFPRWNRVLWGAFGLHTCALVLYAILSGHLPIHRLHETFAPLAWLIMLLYLLLAKRWRIEVAGAVAAPAAFAMTAFSIFALWHGQPGSEPGLGLYLHVLSLVIGYASFFFASFCALLYFVQARLLKQKRLDGLYRALPPLGTLDHLSYRLIWAGFPALVIGIVSGLFIQGGRWSWGYQEILVVATSLVYTAYLHARVAGWQGKRLNGMLLAASACAAISFLLPGGHQ